MRSLKNNSGTNSAKVFGLMPVVAVTILILCVTAQAQSKATFGPEPKGPKTSAAATVPVPADSGLRLVEIFSVEKNPGAGSLDYQAGKEPLEKIYFGSASGLYALAMAFNGAQLPDQYGKNFRQDLIIQMALGTLKSKLDIQVPQFAAATLIGQGLPQGRTRYPVVLPQEGKTNSSKAMSLLLFAPPKTPNELTDEQKLRTTLFAQSGYLELRRTGASKGIEVQAQGKNLHFKVYPLEMKVDVALGTPFNTLTSTLKGKIQFPLYIADGEAAEAFTQRIAGDSLAGTIKPSGRDVASPGKGQ